MKTSSRFAVAAHVMVVLATEPKRATKSDFLAFSVNTNPVVIRRILGLLKSAGLVYSRAGRNGGSGLTRPPAEISLLDIYHAVETEDLFHLHYTTPCQNCPVGFTIQDSLMPALTAAARAMENELASVSLQDITEDVVRRSGIGGMMAQGLSIESLKRDFVYRSGRFLRRDEVNQTD